MEQFNPKFLHRLSDNDLRHMLNNIDEVYNSCKEMYSKPFIFLTLQETLNKRIQVEILRRKKKKRINSIVNSILSQYEFKIERRHIVENQYSSVFVVDYNKFYNKVKSINSNTNSREVIL